jgi:hypothetical protein
VNKKIIFDKKNNKSDSISLLNENTVISDPSVVAKHLNRFLVSVAVITVQNQGVMVGDDADGLLAYRNVRDIDLKQTSELEIGYIINGLNASAANGYDSISVKFLKRFKV